MHDSDYIGKKGDVLHPTQLTRACFIRMEEYSRKNITYVRYKCRMCDRREKDCRKDNVWQLKQHLRSCHKFDPDKVCCEEDLILDLMRQLDDEGKLEILKVASQLTIPDEWAELQRTQQILSQSMNLPLPSSENNMSCVLSSPILLSSCHQLRQLSCMLAETQPDNTQALKIFNVLYNLHLSISSPRTLSSLLCFTNPSLPEPSQVTDFDMLWLSLKSSVMNVFSKEGPVSITISSSTSTPLVTAFSSLSTPCAIGYLTCPTSLSSLLSSWNISTVISTVSHSPVQVGLNLTCLACQLDAISSNTIPSITSHYQALLSQFSQLEINGHPIPQLLVCQLSLYRILLHSIKQLKVSKRSSSMSILDRLIKMIEADVESAHLGKEVDVILSSVRSMLTSLLNDDLNMLICVLLSNKEGGWGEELCHRLAPLAIQLYNSLSRYRQQLLQDDSSLCLIGYHSTCQWSDHHHPPWTLEQAQEDLLMVSSLSSSWQLMRLVHHLKAIPCSCYSSRITKKRKLDGDDEEDEFAKLLLENYERLSIK